MIKGSNIGIIGDLHLGKQRGEDWYKIYEDLFKWIKESYKGKTKTIMFLGDVFDGKKEKTTEKAITFRMMEFVSDLFTDLAEDFQIIVYAGNHCCYYKESCEVSALSMLKGRDNITIIEDSTNFMVDDKLYRIVPWGCEMQSVEDANEGLIYDGIFAHIDIQTFKMDNGRESDHGFKTKDLFKFCNTVWTGHYHTKQDRSYKNNKRVFYAGSPLQLSWGESGKESYIYLLDLNKNDIQEEFINDFSPKFRKVNASSIIKNPKEVKGDILTVIWDVKDTEENQIKISSLLSTNDVNTYKNDFSNLIQDTLLNTTEIKDVNDTVDVYELLNIHTTAIECDDKFRDKVNNKATDFLNRVL